MHKHAVIFWTVAGYNHHVMIVILLVKYTSNDAEWMAGALHKLLQLMSTIDLLMKQVILAHITNYFT